jgi:hypothetical protein
MQIFLFSLVVDLSKFIGGGYCAILHDELILFLYNIPFFQSGSNGSPWGAIMPPLDSSPIQGGLRTQRLPAALPLVNKLFLQLQHHYVYIVARKTTGATAMKPRTTCN